jgi:hypothetical protein
MTQTIYGLQIGPHCWLTSDGAQVVRWRPSTGEVTFGAVGEAEAGAARRAMLWAELKRRDRARFEAAHPGFEWVGDHPPRLKHRGGIESEWRRTHDTAGLWWVEVTVRGGMGAGSQVPLDPWQALRALDGEGGAGASGHGCVGSWAA